MKKLMAIMAMATAICATSCARNKTAKMGNQDTNAVVVYFSATGTTKEKAELIAKVKNAPLVEIEPEEPYTPADLDWNNRQSRTSVEMNGDKTRPAIRPVKVNLADYDTVFLGYPIWWNLAPRAVNTFIESHDLKGKTVIPFATSGGSGIDHSVRQLRHQYPDIHWTEGRLLNGATESMVRRWTNNLAD